MKIRTDFVTNSSSSSFTLTLRLKLKNGNDVMLSNYREEGDANCGGSELDIYEAETNQRKHVNYDPMDVFWDLDEIDEEEIFFMEHDPDEIAEAVDYKLNLGIGSGFGLSEVQKMTDIDFAGQLADAFSFYAEDNEGSNEEEFFDEDDFDEDDFDEDDFDEDDFDESDDLMNALIEKAIEKYHESSQKAREYLADNIKSKKDIEDMYVTMDFSGRGEMLAGPKEILDKVLGFGDAQKIYSAAKESDKEVEKVASELQAKGVAKDYSLQAVVNALRLAKELNYAPDEASVKQTIAKDGKYDLEFSWE